MFRVVGQPTALGTSQWVLGFVIIWFSCLCLSFSALFPEAVLRAYFEKHVCSGGCVSAEEIPAHLQGSKSKPCFNCALLYWGAGSSNFVPNCKEKAVASSSRFNVKLSKRGLNFSSWTWLQGSLFSLQQPFSWDHSWSCAVCVSYVIHKLSVKFQPFAGVAVLKSVELPQCKSGRKPQAASPLFY